MTTRRYFLELGYNGLRYSGFQRQQNANSIQAEVEKAFATLQREPVEMTGSSRTDTGVHALQNFFHFDYAGLIHPQFVYKMNAVLPPDIVVRNLYPVAPAAHARFDALSREYRYFVYQQKNPFLHDRAYYHPYRVDLNVLQEAAGLIRTYHDFSAFAKRNSQVKTHQCTIYASEWKEQADCLVYTVRANRFLRGMVRGLTGTMLLAGRGKITLQELRTIIELKDNRNADFSVPGWGLFLAGVEYPEGALLTSGLQSAFR